MLSNLFSPSTPSETDANPAAMKGNEPILGLVVAAVILVVAVLDLVVTKGTGAPRHPDRWAPLVGIVLAVVLAVSLRWRNRLASPFIAIFAAYFVEVGKTPRSLTYPHVIALASAVGFAVMLTLRHRQEQKAAGGAMSAADRRAAADARRRRRKGEPEPAPAVKRPPPSARYTPPKAAAPTKTSKWAASKAAAAAKSGSGSRSGASRSPGKPKR
jgi:hypothetical protein